MDLSVIWPTEWPPTQITAYGLLGDYIGGVWGTGISALTLFVVFFTWKLTRRSTTRNGITSILAEMLKTHDSIVAGVPGLSAKFLREFTAIYKRSKIIVPADQIWSINDRVDISYTLAFYGLNTQAWHSLSCYGDADIKRLHDEVSRLRDRAGTKHHRFFAGYQATMSHYMRNLFAMYTIIDGADINETDKLYFGKLIRTKLSNYDQALLSLNIISHLGREWENQGIVLKYKPITNVPEHFFGFDTKFSLKNYFPNVEFEWERTRRKRPIYRTITMGNWSVTLSIKGQEIAARPAISG